MVDAEVVGNIIRTLREERGLSQEVLSGFAAIGRTHLSMIERGAQANPGNHLPSSQRTLHAAQPIGAGDRNRSRGAHPLFPKT